MIRRTALKQLCAATALIATAPASALAGSSVTVPWVVVEAGDTAKSLRIFVPDGDSCVIPRARVTSSTAKHLAIRVTIKKGDDCPPNDALVEPTLLTVRIDRKLNGQVISGPKLRRTPLGEEQWRNVMGDSSSVNDTLSAPNLIGLRGTYALRIGRAIGATTTLTGASNQAVRSQTPAAGTQFQPDTDELLLTSR